MAMGNKDFVDLLEATTLLALEVTGQARRSGQTSKDLACG